MNRRVDKPVWRDRSVLDVTVGRIAGGCKGNKRVSAAARKDERRNGFPGPGSLEQQR